MRSPASVWAPPPACEVHRQTFTPASSRSEPIRSSSYCLTCSTLLHPGRDWASAKAWWSWWWWSSLADACRCWRAARRAGLARGQAFCWLGRVPWSRRCAGRSAQGEATVHFSSLIPSRAAPRSDERKCSAKSAGASVPLRRSLSDAPPGLPGPRHVPRGAGSQVARADGPYGAVTSLPVRSSPATSCVPTRARAASCFSPTGGRGRRLTMRSRRPPATAVPPVRHGRWGVRSARTEPLRTPHVKPNNPA